MTLSSVEAENVRGGDFDWAETEESLGSKKRSTRPESQIRWVNPKEEEERKKLALQLSIETQDIKTSDIKRNQQTFDSMDLPENLTEQLGEDDRLITSNANTRTEAEIYNEDSDKENDQCQDTNNTETQSYKLFMTSGIGAEEQQEFASFLESIGVAFASASTCEPNATHVIAQKIARSEKMLGSIASGKWLLHPSYMIDSKNAGKLLPENSYEWGSDDNDLINDLSTELEVKLAKASHRLRVNREQGLDPVFSGIKAIIHTNEQRKASFRKLLELGGGKVIDSLHQVKPPYSDPKDATHCIAEPNKLPKQSIDYEALAVKGVAVVNPVYINEFLASNPPPSVDNHLIEEFKQYWRKRKN